MPSYSETLPKKVRGKKCICLDSDGNRCRKKAVIEAYMFLDDEHAYKVGWVRATLCKDHSEHYDLSALNIK